LKPTRAVEKYFADYAEEEIQLLQSFPSDLRYSQVLCVPVFDESTAVLSSIRQAAAAYGDKVLAIIVLNQACGSAENPRNLAFLSALHEQPARWQAGHAELVPLSAEVDCLLLKRFSPGLQIPAQQGVGLARKIACDMAAYLISQGLVTSPWIFSSDADVSFPADYFSSQLAPENAAAVLAFAHIPSGDAAIDKASAIYELSLQDYVAGLTAAGSNYAFHTIGSCLLIAADAYVQVRGFPKRAAGEDFYLLNKLQKIRPVTSLDNCRLAIASRVSHRVPFGTGPAVEKLLHGPTALFFDPRAFAALEQWLQLLQVVAARADSDSIHALCLEQDALSKALAENFGLEAICAKLWRNHKTASARALQLSHWFDAFKTLKALHFLSQHYWPKLSHEQWLAANAGV
jgi:hypothetical protein